MVRRYLPIGSLSDRVDEDTSLPVPMGSTDIISNADTMGTVQPASSMLADSALAARPALLSTHEQMSRLENVFNSAPVGLCFIDRSYRYVSVNSCFAEMYQLSCEHFIGRTVREALPAVADQIMAHLESSLAADRTVSAELSVIRQMPGVDTPRTLVYHRSAQPVHDAVGTTIGWSVALLDITERKAAEAALRDSEDDLRYTVELNPHLPWSAHPDGTGFSISQRYQTMLGITPEKAKERKWSDSLHPEDQERARQAWMRSVVSGVPYDTTYRMRMADGAYRWMRSRAFPRRDNVGKIVRWYGTLEDIHERTLIDETLRSKAARLEEVSAQLALLVREDHLTGLANRRHFDDSFQREASRARRARQPLGLIMLDVDHFKRFNDTYGHPAGDACLREVAQALKKALRRQGDLAARYGGEEFVILLPDTPEEGTLEVARYANDAVRALTIRHSGSETGYLTVSAGVASFDPEIDLPHRSPVNNLLQAADVALYAAKSAGRNCTISARVLNQLTTPISPELLSATQ